MSIRIIQSSSEPDGVFELSFDNPKCSKWGRCIINVVKGAPRERIHGWNGDMERPTITPSIDCTSRGCKFHGHIIDGEVKP